MAHSQGPWSSCETAYCVNCQVQRQGQQQGAGGGDGTGAQGKPAPKPDERTWIQKNWLFLVPIGLIVSPSCWTPDAV